MHIGVIYIHICARGCRPACMYVCMYVDGWEYRSIKRISKQV